MRLYLLNFVWRQTFTASENLGVFLSVLFIGKKWAYKWEMEQSSWNDLASLDLRAFLFSTHWVQDVFSGCKCGDNSYVSCKETLEPQRDSVC